MTKPHAFALSALLLLPGLSGCAISKKTYLMDGSEGYRISCGGAAVVIHLCFEKAGEVCGSRGYDLVSRDGRTIPYGTGTATSQQGVVSYSSSNTKSIMIRCRHQ